MQQISDAIRGSEAQSDHQKWMVFKRAHFRHDDFALKLDHKGMR
jgi:hypothetical protein